MKKMFRRVGPAVLGVLVLAGAASMAWAQKQGEPITLNFVGAEIDAVARTMGVITGPLSGALYGLVKGSVQR